MSAVVIAAVNTGATVASLEEAVKSDMYDFSPATIEPVTVVAITCLPLYSSSPPLAKP